MKYPIAERFKAPQGEGIYSGVPMAFVRTVGCSVSKEVCHACDTDFSEMYAALGGGLYSPLDIAEWARPYGHVCITGGEPLDRDIRPLLMMLTTFSMEPHIETSGTRFPAWIDNRDQPRKPGQHAIGLDADGGKLSWRWISAWVTVSPKPGYLPVMVERVADEVKVILGGLGNGAGWPTVDDAVRWADGGKLVYVQPRNEVLRIDNRAMDEALSVVDKYPQLRLSTQLHKFLRTR